MDNKTPSDNPWLRPAFLASSCVVVLIIALTIYVGISNAGNDSRPATRQPAHTPTPPPAVRTTGAETASICGLPESGNAGTIEAADLRSATWRYSTATAYPASSVYGPGATSPRGFRYCFQHSVGGALFAAANSLAFDNSNAAEARAWSEYMLADGPYRQSQLDGNYVASDPTTRLEIIGYRVMSYAPREAWIDIAVQMSTPDGTMIVSCVSDLVWQRGDWRFSTARPESTSVARISDTTDYTSWSAS